MDEYDTLSDFEREQELIKYCQKVQEKGSISADDFEPRPDYFGM